MMACDGAVSIHQVIAHQVYIVRYSHYLLPFNGLFEKSWKAPGSKSYFMLFAQFPAKFFYQCREIWPVFGFVFMTRMPLNCRIFPIQVNAIGTKIFIDLLHRTRKFPATLLS